MGLTDNWKKFSEAFKPNSNNRTTINTEAGKELHRPQHKKSTKNSGDTGNYTFWTATQTALRDEISLVQDSNYSVVDISMPNSGTLNHYAEFGGVLTFLALPTLNTEDPEEFRKQLELIRLPQRIDLINLWDTFLVYPMDCVHILLEILLPLVPIGGQINFITGTSNTQPDQPGIFYFDGEVNMVHWDCLSTSPSHTPLVNIRDIQTLLPSCEPKKLALMELGYQDNLYVKIRP